MGAAIFRMLGQLKIDYPSVGIIGYRVAKNGSASTVHPDFAPSFQIDVRLLVQNLYQIVPNGISVGIGFNVFLYAFLKSFFPHDGFQLPHHYRGFVVDDTTVKGTGVVEVFQVLPYGIGT